VDELEGTSTVGVCGGTQHRGKEATWET